MAICSKCGAETALHVNDWPICVDCDNKSGVGNSPPKDTPVAQDPTAGSHEAGPEL